METRTKFVQVGVVRDEIVNPRDSLLALMDVSVSPLITIQA